MANYVTTFQHWNEHTRAVIIETQSKSCIIVDYETYNPFPIPFIWNLWVPEEWRKQRIATELLKRAEKIASDWGFYKAELVWCEADTSKDILEWYKRNGYQKWRTDYNQHGYKEILLRKDL